MKINMMTFAFALMSVTSTEAGTLWLAPPFSNLVHRLDESGRLLDTLPVPQVFGVASNGQNVYFSRSTAIEKRSADGRQVIASWPQQTQYGNYDLAWDWSRNRLWALHVGKRELRQHHPDTGTVERSIALPSHDPEGVLGALTPLGLAYDPVRDRLYVSFCPSDTVAPYCKDAPSGRPSGLIMSWDARNGFGYGTAFRTTRITFGLGYSTRGDTLWVVTRGSVDKPGYATSEYKLDGTLLREIRPDPYNYAHGLDYVPDSPAVVSVGLGAVKPVLTGCSGYFDFRGWITTIGPGAIKYRFVRSDGASSPEFTLSASGAGTYPVQTSWSVGGSQRLWIRLDVLSPDLFPSNPAHVVLSCL